VKCVFMGGSFIDHGGQNPIEPAKHGCKILHGKNIYNFTEIYDELMTQKISKPVENEKELYDEIIKLFDEKYFNNENNYFSEFSRKILNNNLDFLNKFIN